MTPSTFKDHFSDHAGAYARARPSYPDELFAWLAQACPARAWVWDCATGNGQAARGLARHFARVEATDASAEQIRHAHGPDNVRFRVATAEVSGLPGASVDAVFVGQALHWFDHERFYAEVRRVVRPGGLLAVVGYVAARTTPTIDALVRRLYRDITGPYWPPERAYLERGYAASLPFPFPRLDPPPVRHTCRWAAADMLAYLRTWSASRRYEAAQGVDPVSLIASELRAAWGPETRTVTWDLDVLVGRVGPAKTPPG